jgi:chromate transport protein ChrA
MRRNGETPNQYLEIFEVMFRIGSLIFGGGQVVLPMLQTEVVPMWMKKDAFLQGLVSEELYLSDEKYFIESL